MRTQIDETNINHLLRSKGLSGLDDPGALCQQLGFLVRDHERFRKILTIVDPEHRRAMYDSLVPYLGFTAKPLDVYLAEAGDEAERKQLPILDADGKLHEYMPPNIGNAEPFGGLGFGMCEVDFKPEVKEFSLEVTCSKCLKTATFKGQTKPAAMQAAGAEGWAVWEHENKMRVICPTCPASRPS